MALLMENRYGKSRVRLLKVWRDGERHEIREWTLGLSLEGDFERAFTAGDNAGLMATDTMKNTVYSVARESAARTMEDFAQDLARLLMERNPQVTRMRVEVEETMWVRLKAGAEAEPHGSAFRQRGPDVATTRLTVAAGGVPEMAAGVKGLVILKTGHSGFVGFRRDAWTTLPETADRLLGTEATIEWTYAGVPAGADYDGARKRVMEALLGCFAEHESLSVQHTLFAMGEAALAAEAAVAEIALTMPNRHNLLVDLSRFGQENPNEIFVPTDEPHGDIFARVVRGG